MTWPPPPSPHAPSAPVSACLFCGNPLTAGAQFCARCGSSVGGAAPSSDLRDPGPPNYGPPNYGPSLGYPQPAAFIAPQEGYVAQPGSLAPMPVAPAEYLNDPMLGDYLTAYATHEQRRRHRTRIWIAAASVVVVAAGAAVFALRSGPSNTGQAAGGAQPGNSATGSDLYHSAAGHFTARFPAPPVLHTLSETVDNQTVKAIVAVDAGSHTEVEAATAPPQVLSAQGDEVLQTAVNAFGSADDLTFTGSTKTPFQGFAAIQAGYADTDGTQYTAIFFIYRDERVYVLVAPNGPDLDALTASFAITS